jgi:hypothetical protein
MELKFSSNFIFKIKKIEAPFYDSIEQSCKTTKSSECALF